MKKSIGLIMMLLLVLLSTSMVFAEDTTVDTEKIVIEATTETVELTLDEQIALLEAEIEGYNANLLDETLTDEEIANIQALLDEAKQSLNPLVKEKAEISLSNELTSLEEQLNTLKNIDTTEMTDEEIAALDAEIALLEAEYTTKSELYDEMTAPSLEEMTQELSATITVLETELAALEALLLNDELTEAEIAELEAQINEKTEALSAAESELERLNEEGTVDFYQAKEDFFAAKLAFEEARDAYKIALSSKDQDAIAAAKLAMEEAEALKDELEQIKDDAELVKDEADLGDGLKMSAEWSQGIGTEAYELRKAEKEEAAEQRDADKSERETSHESEKAEKREKTEKSKDQ